MERAVSWGIPAAPLFAAMLQALSTTPASLSALDAGRSYLACMAGALAGFVFVALVSSWNRMALSLACWGGAALLELAWIILTIGEFRSLFVCTIVGMVLVGLSTSMLLCLWLSASQWGDVRCEIGKLAVALLCAFLLNVLLTTLPYLNYLSFALPVLTSVPLYLRLRAGDVACAIPEEARTLPGRVVQSRAALAPLIVALGAGVGVLGFGGTASDYGAILGALALLVPLALGIDAHAVTGQLAAPLAIAGLGTAALLDGGAPFSVYLSGCAACLAWVWMDVRSAEGRLRPASPRLAAVVLGCANVLAMAGLMAEQALLRLVNFSHASAIIALCVILSILDLAWRLAGIGAASHFGPSLEHGSVVSLAFGDERLLEQAFGLSPREVQVASLLCENRSVNYICTCLGLSRSTVKTHVRHVYEKAGVHSKDELQLLVRDQAARK